MRLKLSIFVAVLLALTGFYFPQEGYAQTVSLKPSAVPNGVASTSGQQYRQRMDITLGGSALNVMYTMFTITVPAELTVVTGSVTATSNSTTRFPMGLVLSGQNITVGVTETASAGTNGNNIGNTKLTIEFDVTTPTNFAGVGSGAKVDTVYNVNFNPVANQTNRTVGVSKHNNLPIRLISFTAPDSSQGDTTTAGGRFYKPQFASSGLLDLSHTATSGLSAGKPTAQTTSDNATDVIYSFYLSTDSSLVTRPLSLAPAGFFTIEPSRTPLVCTRQRPRTVSGTYIR